MWAVTNRAKPYQLALLIKTSQDDVIGTQQKPLYISIKIFISPLSMLSLQKVLLKYLKECVLYIIYELELPLRVSFNDSVLYLEVRTFN